MIDTQARHLALAGEQLVCKDTACREARFADGIIPLLAVIKLFSSPLLGMKLGKNEAIKLLVEGREAIKELGMEKNINETKIEKYLSIFESGDFPD